MPTFLGALFLCSLSLFCHSSLEWIGMQSVKVVVFGGGAVKPGDPGFGHTAGSEENILYKGCG